MVLWLCKSESRDIQGSAGFCYSAFLLVRTRKAGGFTPRIHAESSYADFPLKSAGAFATNRRIAGSTRALSMQIRLPSVR